MQFQMTTVTNFFENLFHSLKIEFIKTHTRKIAYGLIGLTSALLIFSTYSFFKNVKEDDVIDEFVLKKDFKNATFKNLDVYSSATFKKVTVQGPTNVYGSLNAQNSNLKDINVYGSLVSSKTIFQDINIYGKADINFIKARDLEAYGTLNALDCLILNDLFIAGSATILKSKINYCELLGDSLILSDTSVKKLKISNTEKKKVTVHLNNGLIDAVVFDGVPGEIIVYGDAKVGTIKSGTIVKSEKPFVLPESKKKEQKQELSAPKE
jgi:hypothetical protein